MSFKKKGDLWRKVSPNPIRFGGHVRRFEGQWHGCSVHVEMKGIFGDQSLSSQGPAYYAYRAMTTTHGRTDKGVQGSRLLNFHDTSSPYHLFQSLTCLLQLLLFQQINLKKGFTPDLKASKSKWASIQVITLVPPVSPWRGWGCHKLGKQQVKGVGWRTTGVGNGCSDLNEEREGPVLESLPLEGLIFQQSLKIILSFKVKTLRRLLFFCDAYPLGSMIGGSPSAWPHGSQNSADPQIQRPPGHHHLVLPEVFQLQSACVVFPLKLALPDLAVPLCTPVSSPEGHNNFLWALPLPADLLPLCPLYCIWSHAHHTSV